MARPKKTTAELNDVQDANAAMRRLLMYTVELEKQQGAMDLARAAATKEFEPSMDALKVRIADLELQLQNYYLVHKPADRKSIELAYGVIGTRTGNPTLKPLNRSWTWDAIAIKLREAFGKKFFHEAKPPAPDKDKIKEQLDADQLKAMGMKIERNEDFYAELDRTKLGANE
jgi:phage host-nuclease inhibitor protein Gam